MTITYDIILSSALVKSKGQKYSENGVCSVMMNELVSESIVVCTSQRQKSHFTIHIIQPWEHCTGNNSSESPQNEQQPLSKLQIKIWPHKRQADL